MIRNRGNWNYLGAILTKKQKSILFYGRLVSQMICNLKKHIIS